MCIRQKIFGIYPGILKNVDKINDLDEIDCYIAITAISNHLWENIRRLVIFKTIPSYDLLEERYSLEYLIYQTRKFGVELSEPVEGKHIERTKSYDAWYNFYFNHFENILTKEQCNEFVKRRAQCQSVDEFLPQGNWKDTLKEIQTKTLTKQKM